MAFTYEQIINGITLEQAEEELREILTEQGIQTTDWRVGSPELTILKTMSVVYQNLINRQAQQARNSVNEFASGSALTILSRNDFGNNRRLPEITKGKFTIETNALGDLPLSFPPKQLKITDGTRVFVNSDAITITDQNNTASFNFEAEDSGAEYNIPTSTTLSPLNTNIPISVNNPALSGSSIWYSQPGQDEEDDETLRQRNSTKWSSLQVGDLTVDRVKYLALSASSDIRSVYVDDQNPRGQFTVDVFCANALTSSTEEQVSQVQDVFNSSFFGNDTNQLVSASVSEEVEFDYNVKIYYNPSFDFSFITSSVIFTSNNFISKNGVGGNNYTATLTGSVAVLDLYNSLLDLDGITKVSGSSDDIFLDKNQKLIPPLISGTIDWSKKYTYVVGLNE